MKRLHPVFIFLALFLGSTLLMTAQQGPSTMRTVATSLSSSAYPLLAPAGSSSAPSYSFSADTNTGFYSIGSHIIRFAANGTDALQFQSAAMTLGSSGTVGWSTGVVGLGQGLGLSQPSSGVLSVDTNVGGNAAATIKTASLLPNASQITAGADGVVNNAGEVRRVVYKITVTSTCSGFNSASLNADCTIATFPAKTEITRIIVDNTVGFTCSATCTGTKTVQVGKTAGGTEYALAKDATVIATYGLVNGDLGAALATTATTPVGGGDIPSWTTTTAIKARYVSGTGNWGTGAATNVNAGSTTIYIETLLFP